MSETNKTYRIRTEVGTDKNLTVKLDQEYNTFEILSLQINQEDTYRLQSVNYGVIVGRVLANGGFGIPNAKVSVFIESEEADYNNVILRQLYPYRSTRDEVDYRRYNLLPDQQVDTCHRPVGSFPNKTYVLDNDDIIEIFDKYYRYTTRTNNAGDFIICGVPVGMQTVHMDLDLSDCGILSQKPRDFYYKGYTVEQFENPNQFKVSNNLDSLSQIFSQDQVVNVIPFWGNAGQGETIGVTRCDIDVNYKFEPTCVFIGSVVSDNSSKGISKRCIATNTMCAMDELVTGEGTIEMIRKRTDGAVEEFQIKGTELINSDGVWCYQIPMNLDYMMTDEYGNMVPTDNPEKGIPTRTSVRFRISMHDTEQNTDNYFLSKVLVPNNPETKDEVDFNFGSSTKDTSFRDLFWNNVYTIKSYIPRFQRSQQPKNERFTGIKHCNIHGNNNPMPYNNIRIRLPLMFTMLCALVKTYIRLVAVMNTIIYYLQMALGFLTIISGEKGDNIIIASRGLKYVVMSDGICPDLENWYFAPSGKNNGIYVKDMMTKDASENQPSGERGNQSTYFHMLDRTLGYLTGQKYVNGRTDGKRQPLMNSDENDSVQDSKSIDIENSDESGETICLTNEVDYLLSCVEMNLAQEYRVINFDFYNDWLNGTIYLPRWNKYVTRKRSYLFGLIKIPSKIKGCISSAGGENNSISYKRTMRYTQQCALSYQVSSNSVPKIVTSKGCASGNNNKQKCHKKGGFMQTKIFGKENGGIIQEKITSKKQYVYYLKPCEWRNGVKANFFATDIVLLGSLNDCSQQGLPQAFKHLSSTSYQMPTNLALTNMDDDGYLYADDKGKVCSSSEVFDSRGINAITGTANTYTAQQKYYSDSKEDKIVYGKYDENIPMTEAAGIAWNYTGPDQGEMDFKNKFYQPGGHFLGVSCTNSQTNVKSCVNLSRACEAGTNISQRRELVSHVSSDGTVKFKYYIPTGLIAKDDIVDQDFRSMFATMNHKRLIADTYDLRTGYVNYSFSYKRPTAFDGGIEQYLSDWYNRSMTQFVTVDTNALSDEESEEIKNNSYTRAVEVANRDYYFFRMGINGFAEQNSKYLISSGAYMMPQYQNSFYFYFGLRPGATALDELNKQFFANCETDTIDNSVGDYKYVLYDGDIEELIAEVYGESGGTYVIMLKVPENPTEEYPLIIKVGNSYYQLVNTMDVHDDEIDDSDTEVPDDGGGGSGGGGVNPPVTVTGKVEFAPGGDFGDITLIEPNEREVYAVVELKDLDVSLPASGFSLYAGASEVQISNVKVQYQTNYMWVVQFKIERNTSGMVKFGYIDILASPKSTPTQNYISNILPLRINVTQHPSSY